MKHPVSEERARIIIQKKQERAPFLEIGAELGMSAQRAQQLHKQLLQERPEAEELLKTKFRTAGDAAREVRASPGLVRRLCIEGQIPHTERNGLKRHVVLLLTDEGIEALRLHPAVSLERRCVICRRFFQRRSRRGDCPACPDDGCQREYQRQCHVACANREATLDTLSEWHRELLQRLQNHQPPPDEKWLTVSEAARCSGLSTMVVSWLKTRKILTTHDHPTKIWRRQRPVQLYAASEIFIARQVFESFKRQ